VAGVGKASRPVHLSGAIENRHCQGHTGFQIHVHPGFVDQPINPPDNVGDGKGKRRPSGKRQRHIGFEYRQIARGPKLHGCVAEVVHIERKLHQRAANGGSSQNRRQSWEPDGSANGEEGSRRLGIQGVQRAEVSPHARRERVNGGRSLRFRQVCEARTRGGAFHGVC
jgi:hypothetical protein